jgi:hypothetical protein
MTIETLDYVQAMAAELAKIAEDGREETLAYLFRMAETEAAQLAQTRSLPRCRGEP